MRKLYITLLHTWLISLCALSCGFSSPLSLQNNVEQVFFEDFPNGTIPTGWSSSGWEIGKIADGEYAIHSSNLLNSRSWLFTSGIKLYPNTTYTINFTKNSGVIELFDLVLNTSQSANTPITAKSISFDLKVGWQNLSYEFTVPTEGVYYLGFGITSIAESIWLDKISITAPEISKYYNKMSRLNTISDLESWGENMDGSGRPPLSFSASNKTFHLTNYPEAAVLSLLTAWQLGGTGSKIVIGNATASIKLVLDNGGTIKNGKIDLAKNATLEVNTPILPQFGQLDQESTVIFGENAPSNIASTGTEFGMVVFKKKGNGSTSKFLNLVKGKIKILSGAKLELTEKLNLLDNDLELETGAIIENGSPEHFVVLNGKGKVRKALVPGEEAILPVGLKSQNGKISYNPVQIKLAPNSEPDVFSIGILEGVYAKYNEDDTPDLTTSISDNAVNKTWIISEDVKGGSDITLTLAWAKEDAMPGFTPDKSHIKHFEKGAWDTYYTGVATQTTSLDPNGVPTTYYSISRSGIKSFSPMGMFQGGMEVLPVELINFSAYVTKDNSIELKWSTATEINNEFFTVERSVDSKNFTEIGRVQGYGNSNIRNDYSFKDYSPLQGPSYYRLLQVDYDGKLEYSPIQTVTFNNSQSLTISIYPNPIQGNINKVNVQVQGLKQAEEATLILSDITGKEIISEKISSKAPHSISTSKLNAGTYFLKLISTNGFRTEKLIIQ